mmetsp:Transcript_39646/g.64296  ORF Transcript_39646/g.64296 Transcript_39646/m.64296 type:complete len:514 (+) Transcript_39646:418-1959(+)|eukprot:CAMPEP_0203749484 /NCGR_PEP_ID=MMETSP0098-20131031/4035_1 /ASSEMBLY_ACC=CAM_ASM_000208 /TAXON_ID=96639 /ORGANISM=" , Strain NY0313808BC1" /LENGTH=513 /DNA_ID=CAMNT_0050638553 /DNA_START=121 /DNA_END=1662 /DNA_ORIENTATION=+
MTGDSKESSDVGSSAGRVFVEKVPKPDSDKKTRMVNEISEKIDRLIGEREKIAKQQKLASVGNKPFSEKRKALVTKLKDLRAKRKVLLDDAEGIKKKVEVLRNKDQEKRKKDKQVRDNLKFDSVEKVDEKIKQLERTHERTTLSKPEEKEIMKQLQQLRKTRRELEEYLKAKAASVATGDNIPAMRDEMRKKRDEADKFKKEIEVLSKELDVLTGENSESVKKADKLQQKRTELQKQINTLFTEREQIRDKHSAEWKAYKEFLDKVKKQRELERKEYEEQVRKEREEYERRMEEEEAKKKPWEEEIALCDFLVNYLKGLTNNNNKVKKEAVVSAPVVAQRKSADNFAGMQAVGKKSNEEEDFLVMGGGKAKKNNKKNKKKDDRLTHSLDLIASFSLLSLTAPARKEDVDACIKALEEKRAYYDVLPRASKKKAGDAKPATGGENAEKTAPKQTASKKKKAAAPSVDNSELFPILPGSKSPTVAATPPNGPSAVDLVKSNGTPTSVGFEAPKEE